MIIFTFKYFTFKAVLLRHADAKGEIMYSSYSFLTTLNGVSGQFHVAAALCPREWTHSTHWIGGWVGLRPDTCKQAREKVICLFRGLNSGRPVRSQTLY
jgi:hypothetical protein